MDKIIAKPVNQITSPKSQWRCKNVVLYSLGPTFLLEGEPGFETATGPKTSCPGRDATFLGHVMISSFPHAYIIDILLSTRLASSYYPLGSHHKSSLAQIADTS